MNNDFTLQTINCRQCGKTLHGRLDHESQKAWGRPVDVLALADGAILVSDDYAGVIYRISYSSK